LGNHGFTLLEVLAVLAVAGLLMGLVLPGISAVRTRSLRMQTLWQFRAILHGLEDYRSHYGHYPPFLSPRETPISLANCPEFIPSLQGVEGQVPSPINGDNCHFLIFSAGERDGDGRIIDAFGNSDLHILRRADGKLTIPRSAFPKELQPMVPEWGLAEEFALWSLGKGGTPDGRSWQ
jgi:prepilin-type N-terminal cleavage/methylation domain-containing protein